jgi:hypothetical protein
VVNDTADAKERTEVMLRIAGKRVLKRALWLFGSIGAAGLGVWLYCKRSLL